MILRLKDLPEGVRRRLETRGRPRNVQAATRHVGHSRHSALLLRGFALGCVTRQLPTPELEYRFVTDRKWRFDLAWPRQKVAMEMDGGVWVKGGGRHNRGQGFLKDMEKFNRAAAEGWRIVRCTPQTISWRETWEAVRAALFTTEAQRHGV